jgi:hypothetical protein
VSIKLRGDAGFALPLLYEFCEFFGIQYARGIPANSVFQRRNPDVITISMPGW